MFVARTSRRAVFTYKRTVYSARRMDDRLTSTVLSRELKHLSSDYENLRVEYARLSSRVSKCPACSCSAQPDEEIMQPPPRARQLVSEDKCVRAEFPNITGYLEHLLSNKHIILGNGAEMPLMVFMRVYCAWDHREPSFTASSSAVWRQCLKPVLVSHNLPVKYVSKKKKVYNGRMETGAWLLGMDVACNEIVE